MTYIIISQKKLLLSKTGHPLFIQALLKIETLVKTVLIFLIISIISQISLWVTLELSLAYWLKVYYPMKKLTWIKLSNDTNIENVFLTQLTRDFSLNFIWIYNYLTYGETWGDFQNVTVPLGQFESCWLPI